MTEIIFKCEYIFFCNFFKEIQLVNFPRLRMLYQKKKKVCFFFFTFEHVPAWHVPHSDDCGLHLPCIHLAVAARLAPLLLPIAIGSHLGQDDAVVFLWRGQASSGAGKLQANGGAAGFGQGGALVAKMVADHRLLSPAEYAAVGPPLSPLPFDSCLGL